MKSHIQLTRFFILALLLYGCAHKNKPATPESSEFLSALQERYKDWMRELDASQDKATGWLSLTDCDGTLWEGEAVAAGHTGQLVLAEYPAGQIHRRPQVSGECYPKESDSTVSNDMLTGYVLGMYVTKDLDALKRLMAYNIAHNGIMGEPVTDNRVLYSPNGQAELGHAIAKLGGDSGDYGKLPEVCLPVVEDYEHHLQALSLYMLGDTDGGLSTVCLDVLKESHKKYPNDALIGAVVGIYTGDMSGPISLILDPNYPCPSYVRPASAYCIVHKAFAAKIILDRYPK